MAYNERIGRFLAWVAIILAGVIGYYFLVLATSWSLLHIGWFYFFWSYGLSAVASYMLTDFTTHAVFDRLGTVFSLRFRVVKIVAFVEMVFATALLGSLLNYAFQNWLKNDIVTVILVVYPLLIVLSGIYYAKLWKHDKKDAPHL